MKFEVDDEVKVIKGRYAGEKGYIVEVDEGSNHKPYKVNMQGRYWDELIYDPFAYIEWLDEDDLELVD